MVQSKAADVDAYIAEAPTERAPALKRVREAARKTLTGYDEVMAYGMPTYQRDGRPEFAFASQKQYISLYVMKLDVAKKNADALATLDMGKGCIRYRNPAEIDFDLLEQLLADTRDSPTGPC